MILVRTALEQGTCDVIHIDGAHHAHFPAVDMRNMARLANPAGHLLFIDDCVRSFPAVLNAWNELKSAGKVVEYSAEQPEGWSFRGREKGWCIGAYAHGVQQPEGQALTKVTLVFPVGLSSRNVLLIPLPRPIRKFSTHFKAHAWSRWTLWQCREPLALVYPCLLHCILFLGTQSPLSDYLVPPPKGDADGTAFFAGDSTKKALR